MSFPFGAATTTAASTFGTSTPSTGFSFGGGDPAKSLFGGNATENKPAFNFTSPTPNANAPAFGGGSFAFGTAKTTAPTSSLFSSPVTTSAGSAFGASKPLSFGGFQSPPNQTVGSPGFGQPAAQNAAQNLSFGAANTQQQQQPAPTFGTPPQGAQATPGFGAAPGGGFGFAKPAATTAGFGFATPASGFSAPQGTTAPTAAAPQTTQAGSFLSATPASGFGQSTFGQAKPAGSAFSFSTTPASPFGANAAQPAGAAATTTPSFSLTQQPQAQQPPAAQPLGFGAGTTNTGLSFGTQPAPTTAAPAFGTTGALQPTPGLAFGSPATSTPAAPAASLSFGTTTATTQPATGLSFGTTPAATQPAALNFGANPTTAQTGLNFGTTTTQSGLNLSTSTALNFGQAKPTTTGLTLGTTTTASGFSLAPTQTTGLSFGTSTASSRLSFGATKATTQTTLTSTTMTSQAGFGLTGTSAAGISFGTKPVTTAATSSAASTTAPSGITALGKTTAVTTMASLTTATTTTAAAPPQTITSITFTQLEENINKWTLELEEQEKTFINQATQINAWDRLLISNGEKIVELNDAVQTVKNEQQSLEHELEFVEAQQKELEDLLAPMEKQLLEETVDRIRDPEREHMYTLAENLDTQLRQMSEDLKEVIEHLNETNRSQDSNDPIVQIGRILNAHMSSMQWIDNSIAQISTKLDQLKATHDTLRRDNERSFQLTYN